MNIEKTEKIIDQLGNQHMNEQANLSVELYHLNTRRKVIRNRLKELTVIVETVKVISTSGADVDDDSTDKS